MRGEDGFTLIEALVALTILAIAAVGLLRAAEAHVDSVRALERRSAALWVAENRLAERQLGLAGGPQETMLDSRWDVASRERPTDDPDLIAVTVGVAAAGDRQPLVLLDGFRDAGTTTSGVGAR